MQRSFDNGVPVSPRRTTIFLRRDSTSAAGAAWGQSFGWLRSRAHWNPSPLSGFRDQRAPRSAPLHEGVVRADGRPVPATTGFTAFASARLFVRGAPSWPGFDRS